MLLLVAVILLLVLPDPWNVLAGAACAVLGLGELYLWNRSVRRRGKVVGTHTLVGKTGEVLETCRPRGQVFVDGELWAARCEAGADIGDSVRIVAVRGLELEVRAEQ